MRESKGVRRSVLEKLKQLEQPQIALPQDYLSALKALVASEEQKQALAIENQALKPKADAYDRFLDSDGLMTSGVIGKLLGYKSAQEFNDAIHAKGVAFKSSGVWQFYASFKDKHIGKMVGWEREEFNKAGVTLKWKTVAIDYFSSLLGRPVVQKELLDA
jgi:phage antirepressor YoqD-like protein